MTTGIDRNHDGVMDMFPSDTTAQLARLRTAGVEFDAGWQRTHGRIEAPGLVGGGPMGKAFTAVYAVRKQAVVDPMAQLTGVYQLLADNGDQAVRGYEAADSAAAGQFPR
jgi:hypothetical protein